jgi:hypothetical protein
MKMAPPTPFRPSRAGWGFRATNLPGANAARSHFLRACDVFIAGGLLLLTGCGLAANPQPPTLWMPAPVKDLTAARVGNDVHLHWTMPKNTTDKVALKGDQRAHFCWVSESKPAPAFDPKACRPAGDGMFPPAKPADATVHMPAELVAGSPHAVTFFVQLQNHAGKTAGPSNAALVAAGAAPPAAAGLLLAARSEGVVLQWDQAAPQPHMVLRIHRELITKPGAAKANLANGLPPPDQQTLEVDLDKADPGNALDRDASLDHEWKYSVERVLRWEVDKQALEIAGPPSQTVSIDAKDIFPPAVPSGLVAVVDAQAHAIDLSWTPDTDSDLAGYVVYRRDVTAGTTMERVSPRTPLVAPSFTDAAVVPGHRYAWVVSAIDQDGNESARSPEAEEELPQ